MTSIHLLDNAGLSPEVAERARAACEETGEPWPVVVSRLGMIDDDSVVAVLAGQTGFQALEACDVPDRAIECEASTEFLKARRALPISIDAGQITVAFVDPHDEIAIRGLAFATRRKVRCLVIGFHLWSRAFDRLYEVASNSSGPRSRSAGGRWTNDAEGIRELTLDAPAVRLVESLAADAMEARASDIHIERKPAGGLVRFRVDGRLQERQRLTPAMTDSVIARLKILGDLDVADHRRAQDGRTSLSARGRPVDVRLAIIPSAHGEGAVIRLLNRADIALEFSELGFRDAETARIQSAIAKPQGMFLVSGPTGGGKTTTLYAAVHALRSPDRKIVTVEDPIEYFFEDVHQTQLDTAAGLGFATALRAFLRYDPDIILVGEIRDAETAKTAVQAALTGHLVLSTIHANDAASVPARLMDMGVEPYLLAATLTATSAQRLVRRLCPHCAQPASAPVELVERIGGISLANQWREPVGCSRCGDGYSGRLVISETLTMSAQAIALIKERAPLSSLRARVEEPMLADGLIKASRGLTSTREVLRVLEAM